jgi:hypothetical protein
MTKTQPEYHAYLLRLWRTTDDDRLIWRASLEWPDTHRRQNFATLEALFAFLQEQASVSPENIKSKNL